MWDVLAGFIVVWIIILIGYALGRFQVLGPDARVVLSRTSFFVASPCLLFTTISSTPLAEVLGPQFLVALFSAFLSLATVLVIGKFVLKQRSRSERLVAAQCSSQVNAANLGFPIAAYVLGDVSLAAPVTVFQLAIWVPFMVAALDQLTINEGTTAKVRPKGSTSVLRRVAQTGGNPAILGSIFGVLFAWQGWYLPGPLGEAVELMAGAAIPTLLLSFGLALVGAHPLAKASGRRRDTIMASIVKLTLHPAIAYVLAAYVFNLEGTMLLAAVVMAGLPTAQNVLVTSVRYNTGETVARDSVLITTILGIPTLVLVAYFLT